MTVRVATDAFPKQTFAGKITAISPEVDSVTRNVRLQATLANSDGRLQPACTSRSPPCCRTPSRCS